MVLMVIIVINYLHYKGNTYIPQMQTIINIYLKIAKQLISINFFLPFATLARFLLRACVLLYIAFVPIKLLPTIANSSY